MTHLAIIGTAGRKEDGQKLTLEHWERMVRGTRTFIERRITDPSTLYIVSGGAAWADHLAVAMVYTGIIPASQLVLYLPAHLGEQGYYGETNWTDQVAKTANYYHRRFWETVGGVDSLAQLREVISRGARADVITAGFKARNSKVAAFLKPDDELLAFTFGQPDSSQPDWSVARFLSAATADEAGLKDGGTADTFNKSKCFKNHARIGTVA